MADTDWTWLQAEVLRAADDFAAQLTSITDTAVRVPNLEWSVAELAAHLISLPGFYRDQDQRTEPFELPTDWPRFSRSVRAHITETGAEALAAMLMTETRALLADAGDDPDRSQTLYNRRTTATNVAAGFLSELLLHGMDLGRLTGMTITVTGRQATAIIEQQMALAPSFVDRERALRCQGTFGVRFRGGKAYTYRITDGVLVVDHGRPAKADAHVVADPVAFVLVSLGRMSSTRAGLTGRIVGYGRKPWLLARLGKIRVDGV